MRITNAQTGIQGARGGEAPEEPTRGRDTAPAAAENGAPQNDRIEISGAARSLQASTPGPDAVASRLDPQRLATLRTRIAAGDYEQRPVHLAVAAQLLEVLGLGSRDAAE